MSRTAETFDRPRGLWAVTAVVMALMLIPVIVVALFSFNSQNSLIVFRGFSLEWYRQLFGDPTMVASLRISAVIAVLASLVSVVIGTMLAFGMTRASRPAAGTGGSVVFLRLITPETATAASLFLLFSQLKITLSFWTIVVGHIALCTAFVAVIVRSRLSALNPELEQAAQDLGARRLLALWLVILPPLRSTLISAGLLSFVISFDDFVTTYFTSGTGTQPLPLRIYSMLRFGVSPEVNAAGVVMLAVVTIVLAVGFGLLSLTRRLRSSRPATQGN